MWKDETRELWKMAGNISRDREKDGRKHVLRNRRGFGNDIHKTEIKPSSTSTRDQLDNDAFSSPKLYSLSRRIRKLECSRKESWSRTECILASLLFFPFLFSSLLSIFFSSLLSPLLFFSLPFSPLSFSFLFSSLPSPFLLSSPLSPLLFFSVCRYLCILLLLCFGAQGCAIGPAV